jgi:hypothetical protein
MGRIDDLGAPERGGSGAPEKGRIKMPVTDQEVSIKSAPNSSLAAIFSGVLPL